jgi:hypothetical protein
MATSMLSTGSLGAGPLSFSEVFSENGHLSRICAGQRSPRKRRGGSRNSGFDGNVLEVFSAEASGENPTLSRCARTKLGRLKSLSARAWQAAQLAALVAPYRHARLSAMKLAGDLQG